MNNAFVYLMSGPAHLPYLVASLHTLRQHHPESDVLVAAYPESYPLVEQIVSDPRLGVDCLFYDPPKRYRKNDQFINKIKLLRSLDPNTAYIYLDADTTIHGPLIKMHKDVENYGFVGTQFNHWLSNGRVIRPRLERLQTIDAIDRTALGHVINNPWPSLNGGVVGVISTSPILTKWLEWSEAAQDVFICDEAVLHVLQAWAAAAGHPFCVEYAGLFNASHKYFKCEPCTGVTTPHVWHYHGDSNLRPDKSRKAYDFWWPIYDECLRQNIGGVADWQHTVGNKWLNALLRGEASA